MSQADLRRRMRGSDAMFLYFERKEMPLHIGCVAVLDGPFDEQGERLLASRLPEIPRYRQRVIFTPMNVTHPTWEDDPEFSLSNHIRRVKIDPPGSEAQLSELSGKVFTERMDRNRPLWDLTVIDGLEGGRSALICRVHHCMVDGISGIALTNVLFDTTKVPRKAEAKPWEPPPLPTAQEALVDGLSSFWADAAERVIGTQVTLLRIAQALVGERASTTRQALLASIPELARPTERLPFNGPCSGVRGHCWTKSAFAEARAIRSALGGTINDVVLAVITGAVMRYVNAHREPLRGRFVRMMVPVNVRTEDPHGRAGNEISMIPLSVPLDIPDPAERFREVAKRSAIMKSAHVADIIQLIGTGLGWTPPMLQQPLAAMPFLPQPVRIVNMVCTNVPGPMIPLYANGRELLTYYPHVPCGSEVGISVAVSSYNQHLFYGVTYDMQAAPDGELFRDFLLDSYTELREAAGVQPVRPPAARPDAGVATGGAPPRAHRQETAEPEVTTSATAAPAANVPAEVTHPPTQPEPPAGISAAAPAPPLQAHHSGTATAPPSMPPVASSATAEPAAAQPDTRLAAATQKSSADPPVTAATLAAPPATARAADARGTPPSAPPTESAPKRRAPRQKKQTAAEAAPPPPAPKSKSTRKKSERAAAVSP